MTLSLVALFDGITQGCLVQSYLTTVFISNGHHTWIPVMSVSLSSLVHVLIVLDPLPGPPHESTRRKSSQVFERSTPKMLFLQTHGQVRDRHN